RRGSWCSSEADGQGIEWRFAQDGAELLQAYVQDEPHVGDRKAGDIGNLFVAQVALELQANDLALVRRERIEQLEQPLRGILRGEQFVRPALFAFPLLGH